MLKKLTLSLVLVSLPLQGIALAAQRPIPTLTQPLIQAASKDIVKEITQAQSTSRVTRFGTFAALGSGLGYLAYRTWAAPQPNALPGGAAALGNDQMIKAFYDKFVGQGESPDANKGFIKRMASGAASFGREFVGLAFLMVSTLIMSKCIDKCLKLWYAHYPYQDFESFVTKEEFPQFCADLKARAEEIRHYPMMGMQEFDAFMYMHNILVQKLARLCGYLAIRAHQLEKSKPAVAEQLHNMIITMVNRSHAVADKLRPEGIAEAAQTIIEFLATIDSIVKQAKHIEHMAMIG